MALPGQGRGLGGPPPLSHSLAFLALFCSFSLHFSLSFSLLKKKGDCIAVHPLDHRTTCCRSLSLILWVSLSVVFAGPVSVSVVPSAAFVCAFVSGLPQAVTGTWNTTADAAVMPTGLDPAQPAKWLQPAPDGNSLHFVVAGSPAILFIPCA